jgi:dehydrogenase/reductase SDR family member 7B
VVLMTFQALAKINLAILLITILIPSRTAWTAFSFSLTPPLRTRICQQHQQPTKLQQQQESAFLRPYQHSRYSSVLSATTTGTTTKDNYFFMLACADQTKDCFRGKTVLLTGANGGLGRELALQLALCGAATLILSGRNEASLQAVAEECKRVAPTTTTTATGGLTVHVVPCDLSNRESVLKLGQSALQLCNHQSSPTTTTGGESGSGVIDVLINNGGVSSRSTFLDTQLEVDERVMQINFFSGVALAKALVPGMVEQNKGGKIIWISSVQGLVGIPSRTSYAASKFAVQGYCEGLRAELATAGVSVHVASPGYICTNLSTSAVTGDGSNYGRMDETTANGADPKEVAVTILDSVAQGSADFVVAANFSAKAAIWLRLLCPGILQSMLVKRFEKSQGQVAAAAAKDKNA